METTTLASIAPHWVGQTTFREVLDDRGANPQSLAHAGPPFDADIPIPVKNSLSQAILFEQWATSEEEALHLLNSGEIDILPAQDLDCVVPLAGVISPSMGLHVVTAPSVPGESYAAINEGMDHLLRVGVKDPLIVDHHTWLNGPFNSWLKKQLEKIGEISLFDFLAQSLQEGDDAHNRTMAGSSLISEVLTAHATTEDKQFTDFLSASPAFALNLWMAACALVERSAEGTDCDLITRVGGNGVDFGFKTARNPSDWVTFPAASPQGPRNPGAETVPSVGAIGDSAVIDFFGLGGQALSYAPLTRQALGDFLPKDYHETPTLLGSYHHPKLGITSGFSTNKILDASAGPIVLLGMIAKDGVHGRIGGGVFRPDTDSFCARSVQPLTSTLR